jgi:biopolymer transport protein ExbD
MKMCGLFILFLFMLGCSHSSKPSPSLKIIESDTACGETSCRTLEVQLFSSAIGGRAVLKLNGQDIDWDKMQKRLSDIYKTRAERFAYMRTEQSVKPADRQDVFQMLRNAEVQRVCTLATNAPPKYVQCPGGQ